MSTASNTRSRSSSRLVVREAKPLAVAGPRAAFFAPSCERRVGGSWGDYFRRSLAGRIIVGMKLPAYIDLAYVVAFTAVPILWGAVVHWLFDAWHGRRVESVAPLPDDPLESEVEETNLP